jgi:hypothetical protein
MIHRKDHTVYSERVKPLKRWLPNRLVGESSGNVIDSRSDESLYKPSELGFAKCSIKTVKAGENKPFILEYTAGKRTIHEGDVVKFWMAGQGSLGTTPQVDDPQFPGFLTFEFPDHIISEIICDNYRVLSITHGENPEDSRKAGDLVVGPITVGFKIIKGCLKEGDKVSINFGGNAGFIWKKVVGRKEFKCIIEPADDKPKMRLPEPIRINMEALEADHLDLFIPGTCNEGEILNGIVSVRDKYDNRVLATGYIKIKTDTEIINAYLSDGLANFEFVKIDKKPLQVNSQSVHIQSSTPKLGSTGPAISTLDIPQASSNCSTSTKNGYSLYFGDMHTHDFNSTAEGAPIDCYRWARYEKRLDFQALSVQVHRWIDNEKWYLMKHMTEYFNEEEKFITFLSFEWQHSSCGDKVIHYLGNDMPYLPIDDPRYDSPEKLYAELKKCDAFIISHHPGYGLNLHVPGTRWDVIDTEVDRLVELWSIHGSSEGYDVNDRPLIPPLRKKGVYEGLQRGLKIGFVAGSDTHTARPGGCCDDVRPYYGGLCAIWSKNLTRRGLFEAFMARRTYALTGARINLNFKVNDNPMGAEILFTENIDICIEVQGTDIIDKIEIMKNTKLFKTIKVNNQSCEVSITDKIIEPAFYHCRVTQQDGHLAVSSPVWVG